MQVLNCLPSLLAIAVLRAASAIIAQQLRTLPEQCHTLAVHAAFPFISASLTPEVKCGSLDQDSVAAILNAVKCMHFTPQLSTGGSRHSSSSAACP